MGPGRSVTRYCNPRLLLNHHGRKPKVSVILIDWGVRESFHSLHYLNRQTASRDDYELIWAEFYDRKPDELREVALRDTGGGPALDRWLVLGYPDDTIYHKHRLYNIGLLVARGEICVICDSDAIFRPTFIERLINAFAETPNAVIHIDEVRNVDQRFYPFNYPDIDDVVGPGCINWCGEATLGLDDSADLLHHANYGACMAARRRDMLAVGGADEHLDYLGYVCGPYELTFRLANYYGRAERWLLDEYIYHTWHPNQYGWNTDYQGPHDGMHMALLALEARATFRVGPCLRNPWVGRARRGWSPDAENLLRRVGERPEPSWQVGHQPNPPGERVYWVERDHFGFDVFHHAGRWHALRTGGGALDVRKLRRGGYREAWEAATLPELHDILPVDREGWERAAAGASLPARLWRKVREQPVQRLPGRLFRKARRLIAL